MKSVPHNILSNAYAQRGLLDLASFVPTNDEHAERVLKAVDARTNGKGVKLIYCVFLSELPDKEMLIFRLIKIITDANIETILENYGNEFILKASKIERMMHREVHRMHAFVRFQKANTGIFYAAIDPDFDVLPLIGDHFERRYADQPWIIVDTKRHYALHYNLVDTQFITLDDPVFNFSNGDLKHEIIDDKEKMYQSLWENYFHSVNIKERNNPKLHLRHVPKRYWKYLIEKKLPSKNAIVEKNRDVNKTQHIKNTLTSV